LMSSGSPTLGAHTPVTRHSLAPPPIGSRRPPLCIRQPVQYPRSFLWTETDASDLTYFVLAQLEIIVKSID
jgi:hypothetical protein